MNFQVGPGGQILNITGDVEQKCDFRGVPAGRSFFGQGGSRHPRDPRVIPSRTRGLSSMLRYATTLRFRIASLSNRFAFESLRFRIASLSDRFAFESLRFVASLSNRFDEFASLRIASLSNRFASNRFAFEFRIPTRRRVGGFIILIISIMTLII